jgi:hypothetical protein
MGSSSGYVDLTVDAATYNGAVQQLEGIYGAQQIINLRQVRSGGSGGGGSSVSLGDIGGVFNFLCFIGLVILFFEFLPFFGAAGGGALGAWVGKKTGKTSLAVILAILLGAGGFSVGSDFKKQVNTSSGNTEQIQEIKK